MPSPEVTRKRGREGGADDARPHKRRNLGASASASTPESNSAPAAAAATDPDPPALTGPPDGHRRFDEWKGVMYGYERIVHGNGAMFPTNYQINFNEPEPWTCPMGTCRKPFPQSAQLGAHFSRAHRKLLLVEEIRRGFFWEYGERKNPDKDGRFRSIVVHREFFEPPKHRRFGRDRQPPENWEMYVNPTAVKDFKPGAPRPPQDAAALAAPASTTSAVAFVPRPSAAPVTANRVRKKGHGAMFEVNNPQELGDAHHHRNLFASWRQEAGAQRHKDGLSKSNDEDDDDSDPFDFEPSNLPVLRKNATQQQETGTDTSPIVLADSKQPSDPSKSAIWRYLMTFTKTEFPVPDDRAIDELLTLPKRRSLPRTWQRRLSIFKEFQLNTLTALILYIGGVEALGSPCEGCSVHAEAHLFCEINFYYGSFVDHRYPFPKCVFLPNNLHDSVSITERLGHHLCCNAYYRSWKKPPHWVNTVPNEKLNAALDTARVEVMQNISTNKSAGIEMSTSIPGNMPNRATLTSKAGNNAVQPSPSQTSLPGCPSLQPTTTVRDTTTHQGSAQQGTSQQGVTQNAGNKSRLESSPVNPNVGANTSLHDVRNKIKGKKTKGEATRQKAGPGVEERYSSTSQVQGTLVSSAAASLSNITMQDTSTAPSTSQQQSRSENSQEAAIFNPANKSPQFLGLQGEETELLQASRRHTLECTVVAGSMKVKTIKNGGMAITSRVNASETWTVDPDCQCLVSNFFPAAQEVAVLKVKSKPVLASKE